MPTILALDGHDGSGKTTLAKALAQKIGALYVRPYSEPFGDSLIAASERKDFDGVIKIAQAAYQSVLNQHATDATLIFDRFWVTIHSLLPVTYRKIWVPKVPTAVCWTDLESTLKRLDKRTENKFTVAYHQHYIDCYKQLAASDHCFLCDTSSDDPNIALKQLTAWVEQCVSV